MGRRSVGETWEERFDAAKFRQRQRLWPGHFQVGWQGNRFTFQCHQPCFGRKNRGHPAVFPVDLPLFFIKLLCPPDGLVVDPFAGSGSTGLAAISQNRRCVLIDNNEVYCQIAERRLIEESVVTKSNGRHSTTQTNEIEQPKLLDAPLTKSLPKAKPVRYKITRRKK